MRFLYQVLTILGAGWVAGLYLPFWSLPLVATLVAFLAAPLPSKAFAAGLLAGALLWGGLALWVDIHTEGVLTQRVAGLFQLGKVGILVLTAIVGGLLAAMGSLAGAQLRQYMAVLND